MENVHVRSVFERREGQLYPFPDGSVLDGAPEFRYVGLWSSDDGRPSHGVITVSPGTFRYSARHAETMVFVAGAGNVQLDGQENIISFKTGDILHVPAGPAVWTVTETICQTFHIDSDE